MRFKKEICLGATCWKTMIKALVAQVLVIAVTVSVGVVLFYDTFTIIISSLEQIGLREALLSTVQSIRDGTFSGERFGEILDSVLADFRSVSENLPNFFSRIEFSYALLLLLLFVYRTLIAVSDISAYSAVNEFMTTNGKRPFSWYFIKRLGISFRFSALQAVISTVLDITVIFTAIGFYLLFMLPLGGSWTAIVALVFGLFFYSVRVTYMSFWLPSLVTEGLGVRQALRTGLSKITKNFWRSFYKTFIVLTVMTAATVAANVVRFGIVSVALTGVLDLVGFFLLKCINMVEYYETENLPYFHTKLKIHELDETAQ